MKIQVKFDVQLICKNLLIEKLDQLGVVYRLNPPGGIEILQNLDKEQKVVLFHELNTSGIEVIGDQQLIRVQKVKEIISNLVRLDTFDESMKVSAHIEEKLPYTYSYLSRIFSETAHISIEKFLILKKIDFVKELLTEQNLSLTEIAYKLNYSSVSHLSKQFKNTTGFSPSYFLNLKKQLNITG
ncbi:AraC family transcriptional regulator [Lacinutrix neustonica]|uniref:AraC family transcriptional regulator n=1 Tax=Lacinutrix neustonica TaxID=2980107 RepID=A0A9E8MZ31_9FLAO|nr:AraC family transcriptional regulator [Lacinutrix neustonica]WAC03147.1 AraC family transcriptional regulator [Lacinutrix neustonica]